MRLKVGYYIGQAGVKRPAWQCPFFAHSQAERVGKAFMNFPRSRQHPRAFSFCPPHLWIQVFFVLALALLAGLAAQPVTSVQAAREIHNWYLARWEDKSVVCKISVQHADQPTHEEIQAQCGEVLWQEWFATPPCRAENASDCSGLYLFYSNSLVWKPPVEMEFDLPVIELTLEGCTLEAPHHWCPRLPELNFTVKGPQSQLAATKITTGDITATCTSTTCLLPLAVTPVEGQSIQFWAELPDDFTTVFYTARLRVLVAASPTNPDVSGYRVDIISSQWMGNSPNCCAVQWGAFPVSATTASPWLQTPSDRNGLETDLPYYYLAGSLIQARLVDASECPANGLLTTGYATECGLEAAADLVYWWQNAYDPAILQSASKTGVPAVLLKRIFGQESQFWPVDLARAEFGLGHLTALGADTLLLWNPGYFAQLCPTVLTMSACDWGYANLSENQQAMLQGAALNLASGTCEDCPGGVQLRDSDKKVEIIAQTLVANAAQAGHILRLTTGRAGGELSSYEDLWRYSLVNYHAGPGCLHQGVKAAWAVEKLLDWARLAASLPQECQKAVDYVNKVTAPVEVTASAP